MQPRRERLPEGEILFQVMKRGDSVMLELRWEVVRPMPGGVKGVSVREVAEVEVEVEEMSERGVREVRLEELDVPLLERGAERRSMVGLFLIWGSCFVEMGSSGSEKPSNSSSEASLSSRPLGKSAQEAWTWERDMGVRFSRLADKTSKQ